MTSSMDKKKGNEVETNSDINGNLLQVIIDFFLFVAKQIEEGEKSK